MMNDQILQCTAKIVVAQVSRNRLRAEQVGALIASVYNSLANGGGSPAPPPEPRIPAIAVRRSVRAEAIACLECGARMKTLKRHLASEHGLTPGEYRDRWALNADYPMVAPDYRRRRQEIAKTSGLGARSSTATADRVMEASDAPGPAELANWQPDGEALGATGRV
ncbi:MucR family transcriptional regulator [Novosphingobium sp. H3SJ31-1]|uniref:MucR family transcriptional regulator n=2 Tax=Novosphingobium album (ex Liu et al. 2023) TaxID=3031130 RepID=A0ABT5WQC7_9SPHN|nr:MucR family transcriptional regulator [Novosphingobium album (ex Liu et al. 2023)]